MYYINLYSLCEDGSKPTIIHFFGVGNQHPFTSYVRNQSRWAVPQSQAQRGKARRTWRGWRFTHGMAGGVHKWDPQ